MEKVIVWLTSYNHAPFLRESIDSVLNQTYTDFLLYIVDDCSKDDSWQIIQSYSDPRIRTIRHETNLGNSGLPEMIHKLDCEYLAIAHCDDKWMLDKLEKQVAYLDTHPEVGACFTLIQVIDEKGEALEDSQSFYGRAFAQENRTRQKWLRSFFEEGCLLCHPSLLIRKECYEKYSMFSHGLSSIPDLYQWIQLCKHAPIHVLQEKLSCFRIRRDGKNTSGDSFRAHCRNATELYFVLREYFRGCSREDFLQIFPEAEQYLKTPRIPIEYGYAMILLQAERPRLYHLYGMQLLYDLLNDPQMAAILQEDAGFNNRAFSEIKTREDIFSIIPQDHLMRCKIYFDFGEGFSDDEALLFDPLYVDWNDHFSLGFSLKSPQVQQFAAGRPIKKIRIDPDEGYYRCFWDVRFYLDGMQLEGTTCSAHHMEEDRIAFDTIDPQFEYQLSGEFCEGYIEGNTKRRDAWQVDAYFACLMKKQTEEIEQLKIQLKNAEDMSKSDNEPEPMSSEEPKKWYRRIFSF